MIVDGLYSYTYNEQVVKTVDVVGEVGYMTAPGEDHNQEERGKMSFKSGQFLDVDKRGLEITGEEFYNVEIVYVFDGRVTHGVVSEDGRKITMMNGNIMDHMDEEAVKKLRERDPAENPPNSYNPSPDKVGPILWISGLSGMGKTTTAKLLQEKEGFINYEGDCFLMGLNPYVGAAPKGSSYFNTRPLSGISQERKDICNAALEKGYKEVLKGNTVDPKIWEDFYNLLCDDILAGRARLGGRWVVGQAVYTKAAREVVRKRLGNDLKMIVLECGEEDIQIERLSSRALGTGEVTKEAKKAAKERCAKFAGGHEHVEDDEKNTFSIKVTKVMSPEDVVQIALKKILLI